MRPKIINNHAMAEERVKTIYLQAETDLNSVADTQSLYDLKVKYLGKQGQLSLLMREMGKLPKEERPAFGAIVNKYKQKFEEVYQAQGVVLKKTELDAKVKSESLDLSLPGPSRELGAEHPISAMTNEVVDILSRVGYSVRTGPQIEKDWYNFEALNIPEDHPARDEQDTFYVDDHHVLRTHTSPIQIHTMENEEPPLRILAPGSVFRCDSDVSHSPNFHQIEGLLVDKNVSMAELKGTISYLLKELLGQKIKTRFRPSFFPFTEPSAEFDCSCTNCGGKGCRMCKQTGWVEIGGCGLVNPKVLEMCKLDPEKWQGFAFGFGIERMAIIKYGISHIKLFSDNNVQFLKQFS